MLTVCVHYASAAGRCAYWRGGSTDVADVHVPSVYLPMNCPASSCTFLRRDNRRAVVFFGVLLGGSKGGDSMGIVWVAGAFT